jgi:hypothetical protein
VIKTSSGLKWLTIPVETKGRFQQKISETRVSEPDWPRRHWSRIAGSYAKALHFDDYGGKIEALYLGLGETMLSGINRLFLSAIMEMLGIRTRLLQSSDFTLQGDRSKRLLNICEQAGADTYVSGPSARDYLDTGIFERARVKVQWMDYSGYPAYRQLHGDFQHGVSVIDLILNEGSNAARFMKSFPSAAR